MKYLSTEQKMYIFDADVQMYKISSVIIVTILVYYKYNTHFSVDWTLEQDRPINKD